MAANTIAYAGIVNHTLGGRVFVEAGSKGDLDRQITGFITGVVNKRSEPKGKLMVAGHPKTYLSKALSIKGPTVLAT